MIYKAPRSIKNQDSLLDAGIRHRCDATRSR